MESTQQSDQAAYRSIVLGQGRNTLLLKPAGDGFLLRSVKIRRLAKNLTAGMRNELGHEAVCLVSPDAAVLVGSSNGRSYQVMEPCGSGAESSPRGHSLILPSSERTDALTDQITFPSDQMQLPV